MVCFVKHKRFKLIGGFQAFVGVFILSVVREPLLLKGKSHAKRQWVTSQFFGAPRRPSRD